MNDILLKFLLYLETKKGIFISKHTEETLMGRKLKVLRGTIRKNPDYDDAWLFALAQEANSIFDIGCNIGQSALLMLHTSHAKEIILVDPNPLALGQAANNLIMNHLSSKAHFVCAFVSDKSEKNIEFYTVGLGAAGSMYPDHAETASRLNAKYDVPTTTLDTLVKMYNVIPDLVKIDTEGSESMVLNGGIKLAEQGKTRFLVEMHSNNKFSMHENAKKVIEWCRENQYQAWYLKEKQELIYPDQIAHRGRCHLLLLPGCEPFPSRLMPLQQSARLEEVDLYI